MIGAIGPQDAMYKDLHSWEMYFKKYKFQTLNLADKDFQHKNSLIQSLILYGSLYSHSQRLGEEICREPKENLLYITPRTVSYRNSDQLSQIQEWSFLLDYVWYTQKRINLMVKHKAIDLQAVWTNPNKRHIITWPAARATCLQKQFIIKAW